MDAFRLINEVRAPGVPVNPSLLLKDLEIRVINAVTGELLRELTLDPNKDDQPTGAPNGPHPQSRKNSDS
jgi:hypothetical protein